ncbi:terminase [Microbacterium phage WaterT]|nr:terminase [Microbacterium phage WaterT]QDK01420.1 terminase [Microbacterium phage LeeroyJenkins]QOC59347.1 terminase [Microbacterium phage Lifes]
MTGLYLVADGALSQIEKRREKLKYFSNPVLWAEEYLGIKPWSAQAKVAMSVVDNKNVVVKAGHEVGKSWLAGLLICWWVDTRWDLPGGCFVVSTAPSTRQINAIVWREVRKFHNLAKKRFNEGLVDHPLPGYVTSDAHWRLPDGIELGYGAKPADTADKESGNDSMSGIHARYVLAVGDEAVGLSKGLIGDLANITSNATSRRFLICNPTNPLSYVASIFKRQLKGWTTHTISVFDSPNFHGRGVCNADSCKKWEEHQRMEPYEGFPVEVLETLVDQTYVDDMAEEHGVDSPTYISRVTGEFAWDMGFTLIRPEDIAKALDLEIVPSLDSVPRLGVDVSRSKRGDKNTVYEWHDGRLRFVDDWNDPDAMATAERIHSLALSRGVKEIRIDGQGLGGPIADRIRELSEGRYKVFEILGNDPSPDIDRWQNFRAWSWWSLQDRMSKNLVDIDPDDEKLQEQLMGVEIKKRTTGRDNILLESKEEMAKRGIHSPDHADAAVYASVDLSWWDNRLPVGTVIAQDRQEIPDMGLFEYIRMPGRPLL